MYLNVIQTPTNNSYLGVSSLVASETYPITIQTNTPTTYMFESLDPDGKAWVLNKDIPAKTNIPVYDSVGSVVYTFENITCNSVARSSITWNSETPDGTNLSVSISIDDSEHSRSLTVAVYYQMVLHY